MNTDSVLPFLCELLAKSALITLAAALLARAWRGATAAQRHLMWLVALVTVMMLPLTRLVTPFWRIPLNAAKPALVVKAEPSVIPIDPVEMAAPMELPIAPPPTHASVDWRKILLGAWLGGAALLLGYRLSGSWHLHRLLRRSASVDDPRIRLLLSRVLSELQLHRRPEIRISEECRVPITWGSVRPVLLLPKAALQWSDTWVLAALRHEAAHIRRSDYLTRRFAQMACALYWPNPLVWLLARSLRVAQELAADDLVLRAGTPADEYASQLVEAAREITTHGFFVRQAVAMACPSTLEDRVRAIVDGRRDRRPLSRLATACGSLVIACLLGLSTAAQLRSDEQKPVAETKEAQATLFPETPLVEIEAKFVKINSPVAVSSDVQIGGPDPGTDKPTIFTEPQFQLIMRALNQKKDVEISSSPRITTHLTQRAEIESLIEMRTPTDWKKEGDIWTPTKFETKYLGEKLDSTPRLAADGAVELHVVSSRVEFLGFLDLDTGKTIPAPKALPDGYVQAPPVVPGHRSKGIYSERKKESTVILKPGETFQIADLPETADTKPFEKDRPRNRIVVFVSARLFTPAPAKADATPAPGDTTVEVSVDKAGNLKLDGEHMTLEVLKARLQSLKASFPDGPSVVLDAPELPEKERTALFHEILSVNAQDAAFLERVYLDIENRRPSIEELHAFLDSSRPSAEKRRELIDKLTATSTDADFLRHIYLVITGQQPTPDEVRAFLDDPRPSAEKRKAVIDQLTIDRGASRATRTAPVAQEIQDQERGLKHSESQPQVIDGLQREQIVEALRALKIEDPTVTRNLPLLQDAMVERARLSGLGLDTDNPRVKALDAQIEAYGKMLLNQFAALQKVQGEKVRLENEKLEVLKNRLASTIAATKSELLTREWKIPANLIPMKPDGSGPENARDWLISRGVVFEGAAAASVPQPLRLVVRNTQAQLDLVDRLVSAVQSETHPAASPTGGGGAHAAAAAGSPALTKAEKIIIPKIEMREATLGEAVEFLRKKAVEFDPDKTGIKISVKPGLEANDMRITLSLTNIPLIEAAKYITGLAEVGLTVTPDALVIQPLNGGAPRAGGTPQPISVLDAAPPPPPGVGAVSAPAKTAAPAESPALKKAGEIIIPKVEFRDATLDEAVDFLRVKARELDPDKTGLNIVLKPGAGADVHLTISLTNIPLIEALHYVAELAGLQMRAEKDAIVLGPVNSASTTPPKEGLASAPANPPPATTVGPAAVSKSDPADLFVDAYLMVHKSEKLEETGNIAEAIRQMELANRKLGEVAKLDPTWQPNIMAYRQKRVREALDRLHRKL